jgi:hypothetical protein
VSELAAIENNMAEKFRQFSSEFGMIVIGYGGCDASIMNLFESQLKRDDAFRHGLYWCIKRGAPQSPNVLRLARHPAVRFIEIDGFDEFFAELHESLGLPLQQEVAAPYKSLAERLNGLVVRREGSDVYTRHPIIDRDIQLIGRNIELMSHANGESESGRSGDAVGATATPIPFELLSDIEIGRRNYDKAVTYLLQEFDRTNQSRPLLRALEVACEYALPRHIDQIVPIICASKSILEGQPTAVMNVSLYLMKAARYRDALEVLNAVEAANHRRGDVAGFSPSYFLINKLQAKRHLAIALDEDEIALAEQLLVQKDLLIRLGSEIVLEKFHEAEETMFRALQSGALATTELWWPIFRLLKPHLSNLLLAQMLDQFETLRPASSRRVQNTAGRKQESADSPNK